MARALSRTAWLTALWCSLAAACAHTQQDAPSTGQTTEEVQSVSRTRAPAHSERFQALMSEHFGFTSAARDAMTRGDLPAVRESLLQLADYPYTESVPGAWLPRVRALQEDARAAAQTTTLERMATGVAEVARACGDCHHATGSALSASVVAREEAERPDTFPERMFRHRRAVEQLWLGLVAPSRAAWNDGATSLANASFEVEVHGHPPAHFAQALQNVRELGTRALFATTRSDQARAYASLLTACADCHREPLDDIR